MVDGFAVVVKEFGRTTESPKDIAASFLLGLKVVVVENVVGVLKKGGREVVASLVLSIDDDLKKGKVINYDLN